MAALKTRNGTGAYCRILQENGKQEVLRFQNLSWGVEGLPVCPQAERDQQDAARCDGTQGVPTLASLRPLSPGPLKSLVPATPGSSS